MNRHSISKMAAICLSAVGIMFSSCVTVPESAIKYEYGVFLAAKTDDELKYMEPYKTIVLDAQFYSKEKIMSLKNSGHIVYSYIDLGSYEDDRMVSGVLEKHNYKNFKDLTFYDYDNWPNERWVDVSRTEWQAYQSDFAADLMSKGVDGFFVDNTDVYYIAKEENGAAAEYKKTFGKDLDKNAIFNGVTKILQDYRSLGAKIIINGGDTYVMDYFDSKDYDADLIDAVNQETVLSEIVWDTEPVSYARKSEGEDKDYFIEYIEAVKEKGKDVYLLEYTPDKRLIRDISRYCKKHGYIYYACKDYTLSAPGSEAGSMPLVSSSDDTP